MLSCKLSQLVASYIAINKHIAPSTANLTARAFIELIDLAGDAEISTLTYDQAELFQSWLIEKGLSKTTANICTKTLGPVFSWAVVKGWIEKNPFAGLKKFKIMPGPVITYTREELGRLLFYANPLWKARIMLGASTLRKGEVMNLTVADIDFEKMMIKIQAKKKTAYTWPWQPKDNECRCIPLYPFLVSVLLSITEKMPDKMPYVCLTSERYQYMISKPKLTYRQCNEPDNNFERNFKALQRRAAVSSDKTFHDLRKTGLTNLTSDMRLQEVKEIAGHYSLKTTERYLAKRPDYLTRASDLLERGVAQFG